MPNSIKYSTSAQTLALKKGNFWIGTGDVGKGPTSTTDYYNGITPPAGGYTIYLNKASQGPAIYTVGSDAALISLAGRIAGQTFETAGAALAWFATQTDKMVFNTDYPGINTNGLVFFSDGGFAPSYPTTGTTWYDLGGGGINGTLTNGPAYNSSNGGSLFFDGTDDYCQFSALPSGFQAGMTNYSISIWFKLNGSKEAPLLEMGNTNGDLQRIMFWLTGGNPNRLYALGASSNSQYRYSQVSLTTGNFYNAVYTYNNTGTISKLYINGTEDTGLTNSTANGLLTALPNTWAIGGDNVYNHTYCQTANIYNVLLYTRTLSFSDVTQNYNAQKSRFGL